MGFNVAVGASPHATLACVATWLTDFREDRGGPHNIGWTHPEGVNKALMEFLAE
jgi:non-heme chloroperoxidase